MSVRSSATLALLFAAVPLSAQSPPGADSVWTDIVSEWESAINEQGNELVPRFQETAPSGGGR